MSLFRREPESQGALPAPVARPPAVERGRRSTLIAPGTKILGKITGPSEVVVEGEVEGALDLEGVVVVGAEGRVQGEILAQSIRVAGKVVGNIRGRERVEVAASGTLEGDVSAPRVVIAEGAFFKGKVEMGLHEKSDDAPARSGGAAASKAGA